MKISDIFRQQRVADSKSGQSGSAVTGRTDGNTRRANQEGGGDAEDTISISPLARQFAVVSQIQREDDSRRADRVAELKKQIEDGSYVVKSEDVARAIVSFAKDSEI